MSKISNNMNSSLLISKLEQVNWCHSINTILNGSSTTLLAKYLIENDSYAIMISDFSTAYFECSFGNEISILYNKYNKAKISYEEIINNIALMLQNLPKSIISIDKYSVDCHTTRITFRCSIKIIRNNMDFNWNFHIISTEPDIFLKHFSLPLFRGVMYYYNLCQNYQLISNKTNNENNNATNIDGQFGTTIQPETITSDYSFEAPFESCSNELLNEIFRYSDSS